MEIKHHEIFQVYLPKNCGEKGDLTSMIMEEAHLISNGEMTPDFEPNDQERKPLDVVLLPSLVYAARKLHEKEYEQIKEINDTIDSEFSRMLLWIKPIYRLTEFLDYHYENCKKGKHLFLKHIKFVVLPLTKRIIENNSVETLKKEYPEYSHVEEIIINWINEKTELLDTNKKMKTDNKFETNIEKAENIIINNNSKVKNQKNQVSSNSNKKTLQIIGIIISILMLTIALIVNWDKIF
jgi:hypothetical protein